MAAPDVDSYIVIADMRDFGLSNFKMSDFKQISPVFNDFYPEVMFRLIIVNANFIFKSMWSAIKLVVHPQTIEKISIIGGNLKEMHTKLLEYADDDQIPKDFGGTNEIIL